MSDGVPHAPVALRRSKAPYFHGHFEDSELSIVHALGMGVRYMMLNNGRHGLLVLTGVVWTFAGKERGA